MNALLIAANEGTPKRRSTTAVAGPCVAEFAAARHDVPWRFAELARVAGTAVGVVRTLLPRQLYIHCYP